MRVIALRKLLKKEWQTILQPWQAELHVELLPSITFQKNGETIDKNNGHGYYNQYGFSLNVLSHAFVLYKFS